MSNQGIISAIIIISFVSSESLNDIEQIKSKLIQGKVL